MSREHFHQQDPRRGWMKQTRQRRKPYGPVCANGKMCHRTRESAHTAAELQMDQGRVDPGHHLEPYSCSECGWWHVGSRFITFKD